MSDSKDSKIATAGKAGKETKLSLIRSQADDPDTDDVSKPEESAPERYSRRFFVENLMQEFDAQRPSGMVEAKYTFLKYFDVDIQPSVVKTEDATPGSHLRIYYSDYLNSADHDVVIQTLSDTWKENKKDLQFIFKWATELKPRSKVDAYPMLVMVQEMLKTVLGEQMEFHLEKLNVAQEKIEVLEGDNAEQKDQIVRLQDEIQNLQKSYTKVQTDLHASQEALDKAEKESTFLREEIRNLSEEINAREDEKKRLLKNFKEQRAGDDSADTNKLVALRLQHKVEELTVRKRHITEWEKSAAELAKLENRANPKSQEGQVLASMIASASKAALRLLDDKLRVFQYRHLIQLHMSDCISEMELQRLLQLVADLVADLLKVSHVYIAELVEHDENFNFKEIGKGNVVPKKRFMYAACTKACSFMLGNTLPEHSLTHRHFNMEQTSNVLNVKIGEVADEMIFFSERPELFGDQRYMAMPFFDSKGTIQGFVAADDLCKEDSRSSSWGKELDPWLKDFADSLGDFLLRVRAASTGLSEDYEEMKGPTFFAKRAVEIVEGILLESSARDAVIPELYKEFPYLQELASRHVTVFGVREQKTPGKQYAVPPGHLTFVKLGNLKELREDLQDTLRSQKNEREMHLLRHSERIGHETLKVWRTILVLLGVADEDVLNPNEEVAWARIQILLSDSRPVKERIPKLMNEYDPTVPKNFERSKNFDQVLHLAKGLLLTINPAKLCTESFIAVMLLEWVLFIFFIRDYEATFKVMEQGTSAGV